MRLTSKGRQPKLSGKGQVPLAVTMDDVRAYLLGQDKNALVDMLVDRPSAPSSGRGALRVEDTVEPRAIGMRVPGLQTT